MIADPLPESADTVANPNAQAKRGQSLRWLLLIGATALVGGIVFYVINFKPAAQSSPAQQKALQQRSVATANVAGPAAISPEAENTKLRSQLADMQQELSLSKQQNAQLATDNAGMGQRMAETFPASVRGYQSDRTRVQPSYDQAGPATHASGGVTSVPRPPADATSPLFAGAADGGNAAGTPRRSIKLLGAPQTDPVRDKDAAQPNVDKISVYNSSQYVAPNSYAPAKVLVGVDMQAGVSATSDPKPVLFRIAGSAIGVGTDGKYQTSNLKGCLVNGAAFAELSSEKVYVKLQRISCPIGSDRYLVAKVEGYVTYKGKSGIRGRVVTREGNFANKAFVAGTLQGLGQAMSLNNQRNLTGLGGVGISTEPLTDKQIGQTAVGEGVGNASSMLAEYYIKRAEQYQPVIEMPTGMDVELVFLDTFRFTTEGASQ